MASFGIDKIVSQLHIENISAYRYVVVREDIFQLLEVITYFLGRLVFHGCLNKREIVVFVEWQISYLLRTSGKGKTFHLMALRVLIDEDGEVFVLQIGQYLYRECLMSGF